MTSLLLFSEPQSIRLALQKTEKGIHALLPESAVTFMLYSALVSQQRSGAPLNSHFLPLVLLGELAKAETQHPCPSPANPSYTAQPVFPLRYYRALPALLRALPWEGAGKLSCLDRPWLLSQQRFILCLCFYPTLPKYSCNFGIFCRINRE